PIVVAVAADPVAEGLFESLSRPGRNATGLSLQTEELIAKRLQLLKQVVPGAATLAVLYNPNRLRSALIVRTTDTAARTLGFSSQYVPIGSAAEARTAFDAVIRARPNTLMTLPDGMLLSLAGPIGAFAAEARIPGIFPERDFVEAGGLMSYGPSLALHFYKAASYVDKILKGAQAGEIPVEQPTR